MAAPQPVVEVDVRIQICHRPCQCLQPSPFALLASPTASRLAEKAYLFLRKILKLIQPLAMTRQFRRNLDASEFRSASSSESATTSIAESIYNYRREHGRTYHG